MKRSKIELIVDGSLGFGSIGLFLMIFFTLTFDGDPNIWAAKGSLAQAGFAAAMLFVTVFMYKRQNEITRCQINLSLYEKRYKIYEQIINFRNDILAVKIPDLNDVRSGLDTETINIRWKNGTRKYPDTQFLNDKMIVFVSELRERNFLFDDVLNAEIEKLRCMVSDIITNYVAQNCETFEQYSKGVFSAREDFRKQSENVLDRFKPYLDFRKI